MGLRIVLEANIILFAESYEIKRMEVIAKGLTE